MAEDDKNKNLDSEFSDNSPRPAGNEGPLEDMLNNERDESAKPNADASSDNVVSEEVDSTITIETETTEETEEINRLKQAAENPSEVAKPAEGPSPTGEEDDGDSVGGESVTPEPEDA